MDAPQGRYKVVEKDGRLIVIDNATGQPASGTATPARPPTPGRSGSSPVAPAKSTIDSFADSLLRLAVREWDDQGRAIIHWSWKQNGKEQRWDAWLDQAEQKRFGRALVAIAAAPLFVFFFIFTSGLLLWLGMLLTVGPVIWGFRSISRLQSETNGRLDPV
jgi:hypothetical protein